MVDSANGINGTLANVGLGAPGDLQPGLLVQRVQLAVTVPHNGYHDVPANTTSRSRPTSASRPALQHHDMIRKGTTDSSGGYWKMEIYKTGTAHCLFDGSSGYKTIKTAPPLGQPLAHAPCIKRASSASLVVDGVSYTSSVKIGSTTNSSTITVGAKPGGSDWYKGLMDEVSIGWADAPGSRSREQRHRGRRRAQIAGVGPSGVGGRH